jgi:hypothetical protein
MATVARSANLCAVISESSPDPGWGRARDIVLTLVPLPIPSAVRHREQNGLLGFRMVFLAFSSSLVGVGFVALFLAAGPGSENDLDVTTTTVGVAVAGAILVALSRNLGPALSCDSPLALASSYRSRFFLRLGLANAAALVGFVGVVLAGSAMPYAAGLAWAVVGFVRVAPTASRLERCQAELALRGCPHRLVDALQGTATRG